MNTPVRAAFPNIVFKNITPKSITQISIKSHETSAAAHLTALYTRSSTGVADVRASTLRAAGEKTVHSPKSSAIIKSGST
jgi:hypothetical protein